jgi:membrane-associated phospholipid phosphatase
MAMFRRANEDEMGARAPRREGAEVVSGEYAMTALDAHPGSLADRIGSRFHGRHPLLIAWLVTVVGYLILASLMAGMGLFLVHVLAHGPVGRWDASVNTWFVARRTTTLDAWTKVGSAMGEKVTVIAIGGAAILLLAIARRWRAIGLLFFGLVLETGVFLTTTFFVDRPRPQVPKLDVAPPTSSFPSGHTAAAIVLYVGLAIVISILVRRVWIRAVVWVVALLLPVAVALSRVYRGMHHPTDVLASVLLGSGCLIVAIVAVRCASAAGRPRVPDAEPAPREVSKDVSP